MEVGRLTERFWGRLSGWWWALEADCPDCPAVYPSHLSHYSGRVLILFKSVDVKRHAGVGHGLCGIHGSSEKSWSLVLCALTAYSHSRPQCSVTPFTPLQFPMSAYVTESGAVILSKKLCLGAHRGQLWSRETNMGKQRELAYFGNGVTFKKASIYTEFWKCNWTESHALPVLGGASSCFCFCLRNFSLIFCDDC